jgi:hypothetical protein
MTVFNINNKEVLDYYRDYLIIKQLITDMKLLKNYLLENRIIKKSKTYMVLADDKFSFIYASKLDKLLLRDYITKEQQDVYLDISKKYNCYILDFEDNTLIFFINATNYYNIEDLTQFRFSELIELKAIIKALIKAEINNTQIRIIEPNIIKKYMLMRNKKK